MKTTEALLWMSFFWVLYAPVSVIVYRLTGQGTLAGIFTIGLALSAILFVFAKTRDGVFFVEKTMLEVYNNETEKQEARQDSARPEVGFEPGVPMRTDVDLGKLDADDDGDFGSSTSNATN